MPPSIAHMVGTEPTVHQLESGAWVRGFCIHVWISAKGAPIKGVILVLALPLLTFGIPP